ncbi:unnamed protein product [Penicillium viridicatum]
MSPAAGCEVGSSSMLELCVEETDTIEVRLLEGRWWLHADGGTMLGCVVAGDGAREDRGVEKASSILSGAESKN